MSSFLSDGDVTIVQASPTLSNVALFTSGSSIFMVANEGPGTVIIGLNQGNGQAIGNVAITADNNLIIQAQQPERTPGTIYALVSSPTTANVYITPGFER